MAFSANPFHEGVVDVRVLNPADFAAGALYTWNFGDGVSAANEVPYIAHDFGSALARDLDVSSFKVSVTVTPPGGTGTTAIRTATIPNLYAVNKLLGRLYVPVTQSRNLVSDGSILNGSYTLTNLEDEAITFNAQYFEFQYCDTNTNAVFTPLHAVSMPLAAHEVQPRTLPIDPSSIPAGVCRISLYFTGASASGVSAVASARFEVVKPTQLQIADSDWLAVYKQIIAGNPARGPDPLHRRGSRTLELPGEDHAAHARGRDDDSRARRAGDYCGRGPGLHPGLRCSARHPKSDLPGVDR